MRKKIGTCIITILLLFSAVCYAQENEFISEGVYTMGDNDSPAAAEAAALLNAKRNALEQAGTYVLSNTSVKNYILQDDQINAIAAGVMKVNVLKKTRSYNGNSMEFRVKIKAIVSTDKLPAVFDKIRLGSVTKAGVKRMYSFVKIDTTPPAICELSPNVSYNELLRNGNLESGLRDSIQAHFSSDTLNVIDDREAVNETDMGHFATIKGYDYIITCTLKIVKIEKAIDPSNLVLNERLRAEMERITELQGIGHRAAEGEMEIGIYDAQKKALVFSNIYKIAEKTFQGALLNSIFVKADSIINNELPFLH